MTEGFAMVPNWMVRDARISRRSVLVFMVLASHSGPGGIFPSQATLAEESQLSERTVRTALGELEALGVIERVRRRRGEGKSTAMTTGYTLHPNGLVGAEELPANFAAGSKLPAKNDEATGKSAQVTPLIEEEPYKKRGIELFFEQFWVVYPRHMAKAASLKKFETLVKSGINPELIIDGARRYADDPNLPADRQFIPYPATWLNQGRWDDESLERDAESARLAEEQEREAWNDLQEWLQHYGVSLEEWQKHHEEPGWVDEIEAPVKEAEYVERHRMLQEMGLVRGDR